MDPAWILLQTPIFGGLVCLEGDPADAIYIREPESAASFAADEVAVELRTSTRAIQNRIPAKG